MSPELLQELRAFFVSILADAAMEVLPALAQASAAGVGDPVPSTNRPGELLRPRQAAKLLNISERSLWALSNAGQVPCVRIGRSVRYDPVALDKWISEASFPQTNGARLASPASRERPTAQVDCGSVSQPNRRRRTVQVRVPRKPNGKKRVNSRSSQDQAGQRPRDVCAFFADRLGLKLARPAGLTNGELMRAAGVDVATYHSWICHRGELPESPESSAGAITVLEQPGSYGHKPGEVALFPRMSTCLQVRRILRLHLST
jgi:predicted DNA-binding transcriptional regulator AlpA